MSTKDDTGAGTDTLEREEVATKEPPMCKVVLLNDDYTSMEFVTMILEQVFFKSRIEAERIMLNVHQQGSGIAGIYPKDVAETKVALVHSIARQNEFPLRCIVESE